MENFGGEKGFLQKLVQLALQEKEGLEEMNLDLILFASFMIIKNFRRKQIEFSKYLDVKKWSKLNELDIKYYA